MNFQIDERISNVIQYIRTSAGHKVNIKQLNEVACLSESRLLHLFKEEIGIPIRKYILWCRIQEAVKCVLTGSTLTEAAQICGFSDVDHLNRTYVSKFGITPSHILKKT